MIRGIHHVALSVVDLERTAEFYRQAFGFEPIGEVFAWRDSGEVDRAIGVEGSAARSLMLRAGGSCVELFEYAAPAPDVVAPLRPNDRGYTHFAVDVVDLDAEMVRLAALGMRFGTNEPIGGAGIRAIYGYDPSGNVIELQELAPDHPFALY